MDSETEEIRHLVEWAHSTVDGSLSELSFQPVQGAWERVRCEVDTCTRMKCHFYDRCFLVSARREAAHANVLIVNHHLLCADLSLRAEINSYGDIAILPPYHRIIIDEIHRFEEVATEYFGMRITKGGLARILGKIYYEKRPGESKGVLSILRSKLIIRNKGKLKNEITPLLSSIEERLIPAKAEMLELSDELFENIRKLIPENPVSANFEQKLRITPGIMAKEQWSDTIIQRVHRAIRGLQKIAAEMEKLWEGIIDLPEDIKKELDDAVINLSAQIMRLKGIAETLHQIFFIEAPDRVKWIEAREFGRGVSIAVHSAPLEVAPEMGKALLAPFKTIIMTSATIATGPDFAYLHHRLGVDALPAHRRDERIVPSPFDFSSQVRIAVPLDLPGPNESRFQEEVDDFLSRALVLSGGRAFVLYTAYRMLNTSFQNLEEPLKAAGILALKQGDGSRSQLLDTFRRDISSVLFGTDSFWEGVDVEGSALEVVVIIKLPFRVPTEPIVEARVEDIERKGGNAFYEYTVPQAIIRFKQGFGRLIRRRTDRGLVLILDKRVHSKSYGRLFLNSLPSCNSTIGDRNQVLGVIREFFSGGKGGDNTDK